MDQVHEIHKMYSVSQVAMKIFYMHVCSLSPFARKMIRRDREMQRRSFETALVYLFIISRFCFSGKCDFWFQNLIELTCMTTTVYLHTGAPAEFCSFIFIG